MASAPRFQIFVSSTHIDLKSERELIINELNKVGFIAVGMEQFPATDEEQMDFIRPIINDSDYYIVVIKGRYGSTDSDGVSYTEREFRYAVEIGKPALAFIYQKRRELSISDTDDDSRKMDKLKEFIIDLKSRRIVKYWNNADDLVAAVKDSLHALVRRKPGVGWVRGDQAVDPAFYKELENLRNENKILHGNLMEILQKFHFQVRSLTGEITQESPHFENGLISALFGPHVERMGSPKAPHLSWRDLSLDDCETRTRTSELVIRDSPHQNANLQLHFGPRKNEGMAEARSICDIVPPEPLAKFNERDAIRLH